MLFPQCRYWRGRIKTTMVHRNTWCPSSMASNTNKWSRASRHIPTSNPSDTNERGLKFYTPTRIWGHEDKSPRTPISNQSGQLASIGVTTWTVWETVFTPTYGAAASALEPIEGSAPSATDDSCMIPAAVTGSYAALKRMNNRLTTASAPATRFHLTPSPPTNLCL